MDGFRRETYEPEDSAIDNFINIRQEGALNRWPWYLEFFNGEGNLLEEQFSKVFPIHGD